MNVSELEGAELDAAVAQAEGHSWFHSEEPLSCRVFMLDEDGHEEPLPWNPSTNWAQGGPIIERERIAIVWAPDSYASKGIRGPTTGWEASIATPTAENKDWRLYAYAGTPLIAAMRAYVASKGKP